MVSFEDSSFNGGGAGFVLGLVGNDVPGWFIPASDRTYPWGRKTAAYWDPRPMAISGSL
jgi:hypothetical protein